MIPTDRRERLSTQVYLPLLNDAELYQRVSAYIQCRNFDQFRHRANRRRADLCPDNDKYMTGKERRYVNLLLWENWAGDILPSDLRSLPGYDITWRTYWPTELPEVSQLESQPKEIIMNPTTVSGSAPAFETKHFVFGTNVADMSENSLISAVKQLEAEIADLKAVKTKSTRITAKVKCSTRSNSAPGHQGFWWQLGRCL